MENLYPNVPIILDLRNRISRKNLNNLKVLNVGAGSGYSGLARQLPHLAFKQLDIIDVHLPYLSSAQTKEWDTETVNFINSSIVGFDTSPYDLVLMFDVLEHLVKEDSLKVMADIKCHQIIFIPLEKEYRTNVYEAESQDHLSMWCEEDFIKLGYSTEVLKDFHKEDDRIFDALWAVKKPVCTQK
jgi:hypothetical protein